jgi:dienelactone hydrolase
VTSAPKLETKSESRQDGYVRKVVTYEAPDGEVIESFLFEPIVPATGRVVFLHQHASNWDIGKREIAGLEGDPHQAFGPALARRGVLVLAPDLVGFESRRGPGDGWLQYYNHAMHRLARGELLMTKILRDVSAAVAALGENVGLAGHSHGGNVTLFASALDDRVAFACASGALCSYRHKIAHGTGLEMALVIPGFASRFDLDDLVRCIAPRPLFVVSSEDDKYAADAALVLERAGTNAEHLRTPGEHALDARRFEAIVDWLAS